ncbi:MAG TPA: alanine racemase [Acidimicrobiales bacterium]|jgi:D-serine deaminase-like pyridoxal phosphate-dependent protein|nr:alanine racemase [Acidimicrobiales bacterium]
MSAPETRALQTPALLVDAALFDANLAAMAAARPGAALRPHVKAHKCTELARRQQEVGHTNFCCATLGEMEAMAGAGLGTDLLLANEVVDARRLTRLVADGARITVAIDSTATLKAVVAARVPEVLIDVNVGLPRCGCDPAAAGPLADEARRNGLTVRGVMGYEGHAVGVEDGPERKRQVEEAMAILAAAARDVGGDIISAGGTGSYDINQVANEIQAGSYALMDTAYAKLGLPFGNALTVLATVISVNQAGWAVADCGLKALGMDHGNPTLTGAHEGALIWFCSDEHVVFSPPEGRSLPTVGDQVELIPAHVDPTVAYHDRLHVVDADHQEVIDIWPVDMRGW